MNNETKQVNKQIWNKIIPTKSKISRHNSLIQCSANKALKHGNINNKQNLNSNQWCVDSNH